MMTVVWFLVAITILVAIHEFGHFYVARLCGVKVIRFSIGFGKKLFAFKDKRGTEFAFSAIPLGGYVKMLDEREGPVAEEEKPYSFNSKTPLQRIAIAAAGPFANFVLAIVAYWVLFMQGSVAVSPVVGSVEPGSLAFHAGFESGQQILSIDGKQTQGKQDVQLTLLDRLGQTGEIVFVVRYPETPDLTYELIVEIDRWLRGANEPDMMAGLGLEFYLPPYSPEILDVVDGGAAQAAGLQKGDTVISVDGNLLAEGFDWIAHIGANPGEILKFEVERDGQILELDITPARHVSDDGKAVGRIGIPVGREYYPDWMVHTKEFGPLGAIAEAANKTAETSQLILLSLKKLIVGEISTKNLSGPIGIAKVAADHARHGFFSFLDFLAYLSLMLGVLNLLPIPILDGGHIVYNLIEWAKGSPVSDKVQAWAAQLGLMMILGVMVIAFYNDILRL